MKKWKYCNKVEYIFINSQADPQLKYNGITKNYYDIEDAIYNYFAEECEENKIVNNEENFVKFCKEHENYILDSF